MRIMTWEEIQEIPHGTELKVCKMSGKKGYPAKFVKEGYKYYICSNVYDGNKCKDRLGYEFSWQIDNGNSNMMYIELVPETYEIY